MSDLGQIDPANQPPASRKGTAIGLLIVRFFRVIIVLVMVILMGLAWYTFGSYRQFRASQTRNFRTVELAGAIARLDEILTMSARMAAATGDLQWEKRYRVFEPQLDAAIHEAMALWPDVFISDAVSQTNLANIKLVDMENRAFDQVRQNDLAAAAEILSGTEYEKQKKVYSSGMQQVVESLHHRVKADMDRHTRIAVMTIGLIAFVLVVALVGWLGVLKTLRQGIDPSTRQQA